MWPGKQYLLAHLECPIAQSFGGREGLNTPMAIGINSAQGWTRGNGKGTKVAGGVGISKAGDRIDWGGNGGGGGYSPQRRGERGDDDGEGPRMARMTRMEPLGTRAEAALKRRGCDGSGSRIAATDAATGGCGRDPGGTRSGGVANTPSAQVSLPSSSGSTRRCAAGTATSNAPTVAHCGRWRAEDECGCGASCGNGVVAGVAGETATVNSGPTSSLSGSGYSRWKTPVSWNVNP